MDREWMTKQLPEAASKQLREWIWRNSGGELGGEFLVFHSVRMRQPPELAEIMEYNAMRPGRSEWMAECTCTFCQETFATQKVAGYDAIRLAVGEDGWPYALEPGEVWPTGQIEEAHDGGQLACPCCGHQVTLIHSKRLRCGRTKRIMVESVENVAGYTAVIYWLASRTIEDVGVCGYSVEPAEAYVLTERGSLVRYSRIVRNSFGSGHSTRRSGWKMMNNNDDKLDTPYGDWGSICGRKAGAIVCEDVPNMDGATGEKTGIEDFILAGGYRLVQYLKLWRKHRNVENLVRCGQGKLVSEILSRAANYYYSAEQEMKRHVDLDKVKPHEILRLSKEEFRRLNRREKKLTVTDLESYESYRGYGGKLGLVDFLDISGLFRGNGLHGAYEIMRKSPEADLPKIQRYLEKQGLRCAEVQLLVDSRRMAKRLAPERELSQEELWPRRLRQTHDRLTEQIQRMEALKTEKEREKYRKKFQTVADKYRDLEWNDGQLRILMPRSSEDLTKEGATLRHCVGGYADSHLSGRDTIFFVRKYRRPERNYYTLDIRMTEGKPREVQLHGYGNERHGANKEYTHSIPREVRAFVDRWKREVLVPWWEEQERQKERNETA